MTVPEVRRLLTRLVRTESQPRISSCTGRGGDGATKHEHASAITNDASPHICDCSTRSPAALRVSRAATSCTRAIALEIFRVRSSHFLGFLLQLLGRRPSNHEIQASWQSKFPIASPIWAMIRLQKSKCDSPASCTTVAAGSCTTDVMTDGSKPGKEATLQEQEEKASGVLSILRRDRPKPARQRFPGCA